MDISGVNVAGNLQYTDNVGDDTLVMHGVTVAGRTSVTLGVGTDTAILNDGQFAQPIRMFAGSGDDTLAIAGIQTESRIDVYGNHGTDTAILDDSSSAVMPQLRAIEHSVSVSESTPILSSPIKLYADWLLVNASELSLDTANVVHDDIRGLAARFNVSLVQLQMEAMTQFVTVDDPTPSISVLWDRVVQLAVVEASPGPTIATRAYAMMHTAMFDAWSAYDEAAFSTQLWRRTPTPFD